MTDPDYQDVQPVGMTGARFRSAKSLRQDRRVARRPVHQAGRAPEQRTASPSGNRRPPEPARDPRGLESTDEINKIDRNGRAAEGDRSPSVVVRPYVMTRGRTRPRHHLGLETMVATNVRGAPQKHEPFFDEERRAVELCLLPRSVAEVAALLEIPLGVSRVVLGDLAERRIVIVQHPSDTTDPALLHRILTGLRNL
ncbi:MAG TPA: DUF742 domain-containing protein [Pseudonocardiaceae bacterium]